MKQGDWFWLIGIAGAVYLVYRYAEKNCPGQTTGLCNLYNGIFGTSPALPAANPQPPAQQTLMADNPPIVAPLAGGFTGGSPRLAPYDTGAEPPPAGQHIPPPSGGHR